MKKVTLCLTRVPKSAFRSWKAVVFFLSTLCRGRHGNRNCTTLHTDLQGCVVASMYCKKKQQKSHARPLCLVLSGDSALIQKPHFSVVVCYHHWGAYMTIWHKCTDKYKYSQVAPESPKSKSKSGVARAGTLEAAEFPSTRFTVISLGIFALDSLTVERDTHTESRDVRPQRSPPQPTETRNPPSINAACVGLIYTRESNVSTGSLLLKRVKPEENPLREVCIDWWI